MEKLIGFNNFIISEFAQKRRWKHLGHFRREKQDHLLQEACHCADQWENSFKGHSKEFLH